MNHGPRRLGGPVAAGVLVIALIVRCWWSALTPGTATPPPTPRTTVRRTATTSATRGHAGSAAGKGSRKATTTTTTEPAQFAPVSTSAQGATYTPPAAQYSLVVSTTTGRCWVQVRSVSSGSTLFAQTLDAGAQQEISANGGVTVLLGAPAVATVTLDGAPVVLPSVAVTPLVLTFTPAVSTAGSPTTTTPTPHRRTPHSPNTASADDLIDDLTDAPPTDAPLTDAPLTRRLRRQPG